MITYQIEMRDLEKQIELLEKFPQASDKHIHTAMVKSVTTLRTNILPNVPVGVTGRLRGSIDTEVKTLGHFNITGRVGSNLRDEVYPAVMELGRSPGSMPPPHKLARWVHIVLGVPAEREMAVAYLVARSIARRGIKGREFMKKGLEASLPKIEHYFLQAIDKTLAEMEVQ